jgi:hypothetical protein
MTEKNYRIVQWKEENKIPDEGKPLMSVKQAKRNKRLGLAKAPRS